MIIDLKRSIDLRWLFDPALSFILRWSCWSITQDWHSRYSKKMAYLWLLMIQYTLLIADTFYNIVIFLLQRRPSSSANGLHEHRISSSRLQPWTTQWNNGRMICCKTLNVQRKKTQVHRSLPIWIRKSKKKAPSWMNKFFAILILKMGRKRWKSILYVMIYYVLTRSQPTWTISLREHQQGLLFTMPNFTWAVNMIIEFFREKS